MGQTSGDISALFFDLDGTLADPRDGMTKCLTHALVCLDRPVPPVAELVQYIGPSLRWTFSHLLDTDDPEPIEAAVSYYRQRYSTVGLFEQEVYPGVPSLLEALCADGFVLYVVTSKPAIFAKKIVEHFDLARYFEDVFGPELNGRFDDKGELISHIFQQRSLDPRRCVMIGDRASDVTAGKTNGTHTIALTYGFGTAEELATAGSDQTCDSPESIRPAVLEMFPAP